MCDARYDVIGAAYAVTRTNAPICAGNRWCPLTSLWTAAAGALRSSAMAARDDRESVDEVIHRYHTATQELCACSTAVIEARLRSHGRTCAEIRAAWRGVGSGARC